MKKVALTLNALLLGTLSLVWIAKGPPPNDMALVVVAALVTSAATLYAFRSDFSGNAAGEETAAAPERRAGQPASPRRVEAREDRRPLYEWIDTVEERLDAMETSRHPEADGSERNTVAQKQ